MTVAAAVVLLAVGLYEQALSRLLLERFTRPEYLLIDFPGGRTIAKHWDNMNDSVPVGSLWKPLLVVASTRNSHVDCKPGMCWLPRGHGRIALEEALAQSCNAWFLRHASGLPAGSVESAAKAVGLPAPPKNSPETLIGLDGEWIVRPAAMAHAYIQLVAASSALRRGMALAAIDGTAQRIALDALAKTGTAPCAHPRGGPGDGYVIALWPRERPRYILMLRMHGTTGAVAAEIAGSILRTVRDGR
jgi:cell division protein FtsI/penicillin-binding protein 2